MRKSILLLLLCSNVARSQDTYFNIQFDYDSIWNAVFGIVETDSLYLATGVFATPSTYDTGYVLKLTKNGDFAGVRKIDFYPGSKLRDIQLTPIQGDAVDVYGIHHEGFDEVINTDIFVSRLVLPSLDTLKVRSFGAANFGDYANTSLILQTSDNGIVLTGYRFAPNQKNKLLLLKTDSLWNQVFMKTYSQSTLDNHTGHSVVETPDKGFIVVGSRSYNIYDLQGTYLRVDSLGNQLWWKDIVPQGDEEFILLTDITRLANGTYLVLGRKQYDILGFPRYMVHVMLNINEEGDVLWSKEYGSDIYNDAGWRGLTLCPDGNYITGGTTRENQYVPNRKAYGTIAKISSAGEVLWERKYSASTEGQLYDVFWRTIPTSDGGIIACGSTWGDSITRENSWIVKLDSLGCLEPGCDTTTGVIELPVGDRSHIKIYPNPTSGRFSVEAQGGKMIKAIKLYDLQGRIIINETYKTRRDRLNFDIGEVPSGTYFCTALVDKTWVTRQVVVR